MASLSPKRIAELLEPYVGTNDLPPMLIPQLSIYLELLLRWNARTNLTAIREPEEIVRRHFGESLFAGLHLPPSANTMLDYGSGAGFPGLPIQLLRLQLTVTLAESQGKKASFLREAVRSLEVETEVWPGRVESLPEERRFDVVVMRAVDKMEAATRSALLRVKPGGTLAVFTSDRAGGVPVPMTDHTVLKLIERP